MLFKHKTCYIKFKSTCYAHTHTAISTFYNHNVLLTVEVDFVSICADTNAWIQELWRQKCIMKPVLSFRN